jgi:hypothetical protein
MSLKCKYNIDKFYGVTTTLDFGKYKGYSVGNILEMDPAYILWASQNVETFRLTKSVRDVLFEYENNTDDIGFDPVWDIYMK